MIEKTDLEVLQPVGDVLLCKPVGQKEKKTGSGIVLPTTTSQESMCEAVVVSVSEKLSQEYSIGDRVFYQNNGYDSNPTFVLDAGDSDTKYICLNKNFVLMKIGGK